MEESHTDSVSSAQPFALQTIHRGSLVLKMTSVKIGTLHRVPFETKAWPPRSASTVMPACTTALVPGLLFVGYGIP